MNLLSIFRKDPQASNPDTLNSRLKLSATEVKRIKSMAVELALQAQQLTKRDIGVWRTAWQMAINPENPQRVQLYGVYTDVDIDMHLTGCVGQRTGMVTKKAFKVVDKNGKEKPELTELLQYEWFKDFVRLALESRYWGHSLIQFGDILTSAGKTYFEKVELVPRRHVIPEYGVIVKEAGDEWKKGISYRDSRMAEWCIEVGKSNDLGLFLKCAPHALSKKNMIAYWDQFGEMFGMPVRIAKTNTRDDKEITKVEDMMENLGAKAWGIFQEGTTIEFVESTRGDAFNVYDKRVQLANAELSKGILNQTMTIDNGSSLSQSEVHLEVFENVVNADADMVRDVVNNKLFPFLTKHGFNIGDHRFEWDNAVQYTPAEQQKVEELLLGNYDIDPQYFIEKYNIPVLAKKQNTQLGFFD